MQTKHEHGTKNEIIQQEERIILAKVDGSIHSSANSQTIGRSGETAILDFLDKYLPPIFRVASGNFITPNGNISPQIDIMVLDARYPLLSQNTDGSVLAMLHSVVNAIEIKTNMTSVDIKKICSNTKKIQLLFNELDCFCRDDGWNGPTINTVACRCKNKIKTIENSYKKHSNPEHYHSDITILRFSKKDKAKIKDAGCELHFEPTDETNTKFYFCNIVMYTPLSDFYYKLIQDGYYILGNRNFSFNDLGQHMMNYMSWSNNMNDKII
jgi:hypothetical protein